MAVLVVFKSGDARQLDAVAEYLQSLNVPSVFVAEGSVRVHEQFGDRAKALVAGFSPIMRTPKKATAKAVASSTQRDLFGGRA